MALKSALAVTAYEPRQRPNDEPPLTGAPGLVAAIIVQAIADACGVNYSKLKTRDIEGAQRYLRGHEWEPLIEAAGGNVIALRRELEHRYKWMKE